MKNCESVMTSLERKMPSPVAVLVSPEPVIIILPILTPQKRTPRSSSA